jgi:hypothetical protein
MLLNADALQRLKFLSIIFIAFCFLRLMSSSTTFGPFTSLRLATAACRRVLFVHTMQRTGHWSQRTRY